jgi:hypothetical protein
MFLMLDFKVPGEGGVRIAVSPFMLVAGLQAPRRSGDAAIRR